MHLFVAINHLHFQSDSSLNFSKAKPNYLPILHVHVFYAHNTHTTISNDKYYDDLAYNDNNNQ